jgi:hypothetical protein
MYWRSLTSLLGLLLVVASAACGRSGSVFNPCTGSSGSCNSGIVSGATDAHCAGTIAPAPSTFTCPTSDANATADANSTVSTYRDTMYDNSGDDDDCKYRVSWVASDVKTNTNVEFKVTANWLADGTPLQGAYTHAEVFLGPTHPAPNTNASHTESPAGTYAITPIVFDEPGQWTVRFHFYEDCVDADNSLHGHAAFYVNVK